MDTIPISYSTYNMCLVYMIYKWYLLQFNDYDYMCAILIKINIYPQVS